MNIIKAERATFEYVEGIKVDFYKLPSGEYRIGLASASIALGFASNWLDRATSREKRTLKTLQGIGYTNVPIQVKLDAINGGGTSAKTISIADFQILKIYAVQKGKQEAIKLLSFNALNSDLDIAADLFQEKRLSYEEKRAIWYKELAATINWLEDDRHEWQLIQEQELFLGGIY